jgi:hypothetical protein
LEKTLGKKRVKGVQGQNNTNKKLPPPPSMPAAGRPHRQLRLERFVSVVAHDAGDVVVLFIDWLLFGF